MHATREETIKGLKEGTYPRKYFSLSWSCIGVDIVRVRIFVVWFWVSDRCVWILGWFLVLVWVLDSKFFVCVEVYPPQAACDYISVEVLKLH